MKKTLYILAAAVLVLSSSCSRKVNFTDIPFVYFDNASMSVYEDAGTVEIPVHSSFAGDFAVTFQAIDGQKKNPATGSMVPNGEAGKDYSIVDNDAAILRFTPDNKTQMVKVDITDFPGVLTGNKDFTLKLLTAGNEVSLGGFSAIKVTIIDNDHPLKEILGAYDAKAHSYFSDSDIEWTMTLVADPDDYFKVWIDGILPEFAGNYLSGAEGKNHAVYATFNKIDETTANLNSFTIAGGQKFADTYQDYDIAIMAFNGSGVGASPITFTKEDDVYKASSGYGANISGTNSYLELVNPYPTIKKK